MAPGTKPPTAAAPTAHPQQPASAGVGAAAIAVATVAAAAKAISVFFISVSLKRRRVPRIYGQRGPGAAPALRFPNTPDSASPRFTRGHINPFICPNLGPPGSALQP